jgi:hypothetical protein
MSSRKVKSKPKESRKARSGRGSELQKTNQDDDYDIESTTDYNRSPGNDFEARGSSGVMGYEDPVEVKYPTAAFSNMGINERGQDASWSYEGPQYGQIPTTTASASPSNLQTSIYSPLAYPRTTYRSNEYSFPTTQLAGASESLDDDTAGYDTREILSIHTERMSTYTSRAPMSGSYAAPATYGQQSYYNNQTTLPSKSSNNYDGDPVNQPSSQAPIYIPDPGNCKCESSSAELNPFCRVVIWPKPPDSKDGKITKPKDNKTKDTKCSSKTGVASKKDRVNMDVRFPALHETNFRIGINELYL